MRTLVLLAMLFAPTLSLAALRWTEMKQLSDGGVQLTFIFNEGNRDQQKIVTSDDDGMLTLKLLHQVISDSAFDEYRKNGEDKIRMRPAANWAEVKDVYLATIARSIETYRAWGARETKPEQKNIYLDLEERLTDALTLLKNLNHPTYRDLDRLVGGVIEKAKEQHYYYSDHFIGDKKFSRQGYFLYFQDFTENYTNMPPEFKTPNYLTTYLQSRPVGFFAEENGALRNWAPLRVDVKAIMDGFQKSKAAPTKPSDASDKGPHDAEPEYPSLPKK